MRTAVLFDLFDTLVHFDRERLPLLTIDGRPVRSTAGHLLDALRPHAPALAIEQVFAALVASWQEAERLRAIDHREVAAPERFADFLARLGLAAAPAALVETLIETHRRELARAADFPARHGALLRALAPRYRLAVVSNFDYAPTAIGILEHAGVADLFATIVVSDQIGWRKPRPEIFAEALRRLGIGPAEALFVGDRADIDVVGAQQAGIPVAWINPQRDPLPAGIGAPEFEIRDLAELEEILGS
jgi:FMN phosphatase YigB (HAD superfamily)